MKNSSITQTLQARMDSWMQRCFGKNISENIHERNFRVLEECLELVQASGLNKQEAQVVLDYVYSRPAGDVRQEIGGAVLTLSAYCSAHNLDMLAMAEEELARIEKIPDKVREKHRTKPDFMVAVRE
ncbi:MAG: hypothetical protein R3261_15135 [Alphaproteobacteria bacterium]|nr:hypothetical protein [Alphaproteobacteria bacterium]